MKNILYFVFLTLISFSSLTSCSKDTNLPPTSLELILKDTLGKPVYGASVRLFKNSEFVQYGMNSPFQIGKTQISDSSGKVLFSNLSILQYYFYADKDCYNNYNGIITSTIPIKANIKNTFNVILTSTGTISFINESGNTYQIYLNGVLKRSLHSGLEEIYLYMPIGSYIMRIVQLDGYVNSPVDKTITGTLTCGSTITINCP